ncbi:MAG TPA: sigma-70 family RNA polymerase sigma factor [Synergistetes bacterium]|nr:sigma-70 family RNA polymerase sigma factor [Synergistota bacterium]
MGRKRRGGVCFLSPDRTYRPRQEEDVGEATLEILAGEDPVEEPEIDEDPECDREVRRTIYELFHADIRDIPLLTAQEEKELSRRILDEGDKEAFDRFVMSNLRLVIACAKKVKDRMGDQSILSFMDMIQEGVMGLMTAVEKFDYRMNTRFSTYGIPWIYQRIKMALLQHRYGMSIPGFASTSVHTMSRYIQAYRKGKLGEIPEGIDVGRIRDLSNIVSSMISISTEQDEDGTGGGYSLNPERICNDHFWDPWDLPGGTGCDEEVEKGIFCENITAILESELTEEEYGILCRRFGIGGFSSPRRLSDIAAEYDKSAEHIRIVLNRSMEKLRKNGVLKDVCSSWGI